MANHRCAVLGKPVAHSLSPVLHNAAYRSLKLDDWLYDKHEVGEDDLDAFLKGRTASRASSYTTPMSSASNSPSTMPIANSANTTPRREAAPR